MPRIFGLSLSLRRSLFGPRHLYRGWNDILQMYFGDRKLKDVTPNLIAAYKSFCRGKGLSPASINHRRGLLRHAFNLAMREWVKENPVDRVSPEKVRNARDGLRSMRRRGF